MQFLFQEISSECTNKTTRVICKSECFIESTFLAISSDSNDTKYKICSISDITLNYQNSSSENCDIFCSNHDAEIDTGCLYKSISFWSFVILMSVGTIGFNVVNSISDAICFDVIGKILLILRNKNHIKKFSGEDGDYGKQRVWGTIGFGLTALISGYVVNIFSEKSINYTPAFIIILVCSVIDLIACVKLQVKNTILYIKKMLTPKFSAAHNSSS